VKHERKIKVNRPITCEQIIFLLCAIFIHAVMNFFHLLNTKEDILTMPSIVWEKY